MLTQQSTQTFKVRIVPKYGDRAIIYALCTSNFWRHFFKKDRLALWQILKELGQLQIAMFAYALGAVFRFKHGTQTTGIIMTFFTLTYMTVFNSVYVWPIFKPLVFIIAPSLPFINGLDWTQRIVFDNIHSVPLLIFLIAFSILSIIHTLMIYTGYGNSYDSSKRGNSYLYEFAFSKTRLISEYLVQVLIEPLLAALAGWIFWEIYDDKAFAIFLWLGAISLFLQEILDREFQHKMQPPF